MPLISVQELLNAQADTAVNVPLWAAGNYNNITTSAQTVVKSSSGVLLGVSWNNTLTSAIRGYDNTVSGGTQLFTVPASTAANSLRYGLKFTNGLVISSGAAADNITIIYL